MKNRSYFSFGDSFNLRKKFDRWLNPFSQVIQADYNGKPLKICYTARAGRVLEGRAQPLIVEMQLYFSCVVLKRVLFHDQSDFSVFPVSGKLSLAFNTVESASCDPVKFAQLHPAKRMLDSAQALKMRPRQLMLDYKNKNWTGVFIV